MFDGGMIVSFQFHKLNYPPVRLGNIRKHWNQHRARPSLSTAVQFSSVHVQIDASNNSPQSKTISGSGSGSGTAPKKYHTPNSSLNQRNTVGIIGGVSVFSTLVFLEKLVWWSSRDGQECLSFVVCSDPKLTKVLPMSNTSFHSFNSRNAQTELNFGPIIENLRHKRRFLEQSGAHCIVMPCHLAHAWHDEVSEGCSLPFFHVGECVASELKEAKLRPLEAGSNVRIGVLATNATLTAGFYQDKLQSQGFEVVLPDKATMDHILSPAIEAMKRKDMEGAQNLLRIAIQILLVRAANTVILASDEIQGLLPCNDPLVKKCVDPMDALARSTLRWAKCKGNN